MAKFLNAQATAAALISKNGSKVTVKRRTGTGFDPVTQAETESLQTEDFIAVAMPPGQQARFQAQTLQRTVAFEVYFSLKGRTLRPEPGDVVRMNGKDYKLFWATTYDPALDGPIFTLAYVSA
jgi:hypothetical protein